MEIKYEPVFGPQELFDDAPIEATHATQGGGFYRATDGGGVQYLSRGPLNVCMCKFIGGYLIAERRIIRTPIWTVEDQKAGRPPEVGSIFTYRDETLTCHFIDGDGEIWAHDIDNKIVTPVLRDCRSIETPAEKAQRLEDEFFEQVKLEGMNANTPQKTSSLFELGVRAAYRKLSGELSAPKGGE